jgi:threonine/homoserine/homoserine lactone efflux protein
MRLAGAAYLAYLGVMSWFAPVPDAPAEPAAEVAPLAGEADARRLYRQGVFVAASNPKAILFAAAFFPQFLNPEQAQLPQFGILLATFSVIEVGWYLVYAASGQRLSVYLRRPAVLRMFNRLTGGIFIGFAALMSNLNE